MFYILFISHRLNQKCLNQNLMLIILGKVISEIKVWVKDVNEIVVIFGSSILSTF